jgi:hypothetical protein
VTRGERRGIRCCGRFAYWRVPIGPWQCTKCPRVFDGPMPASAERRFWNHVDAIAAMVPPWTHEQRVFVRRCFPGAWSTTVGPVR